MVNINSVYTVEPPYGTEALNEVLNLILALDIQFDGAFEDSVVGFEDDPSHIHRHIARYDLGQVVEKSGAVQAVDDVVPGTASVREIVYVVENGSTVVYIKSDTDIYRTDFSEDLLFLEPGDEFSFFEMDVTEAGVRRVFNVKKK